MNRREFLATSAAAAAFAALPEPTMAATAIVGHATLFLGTPIPREHRIVMGDSITHEALATSPLYRLEDGSISTDAFDRQLPAGPYFLEMQWREEDGKEYQHRMTGVADRAIDSPGWIMAKFTA